MKLMNLKILMLLSVGLLLVTIGCEEFEVGNDFLSKPPELDYTLDSAFASSDRAKEVLWNAYATLPWGLPSSRPEGDKQGWRGGIGHTPRWSLTDLYSHDMSWDGVAAFYKLGTYNAEAVNEEVEDGGSWRGRDNYAWIRELGWEGIRDSYVFIDNIDRVPDMSEAEKTRLKAEAHMIAATHYVHLFRHYGGILYVDHAYEVDENTDLERLTVMQTVDTIIAKIDKYKDDLPFELDNPAQWSGRFTSAGAMALKVKLLSFAAGPLFNSNEPYMQGEAATKKLVWTGGYKQELWERLRDASKELIDKIESSSYYGLVDTGNPREDFRSAYYDRGTGETLISIRRNYRISRWQDSDEDLSIIKYGQNSWDMANPLHNFAMRFPMKNGMSIDNPASGYDPQNPFYNRDPRFYENLTVTGNIRGGRKAEMWIGGRERESQSANAAYTGYRSFKWVLDGDNMIDGKIIQWPFIRIPEVYLSYAEALNELNNGPTNEAFEYVNKVRERVDVGPIEDYIGKARSEITKEEFLEALLNERILELACEDIRWYDMARYKLKDQFEQTDLGLDMEMNALAESKNDIEEYDFTTFFQDSVDYDDHGMYFDINIREVTKGRFTWQDGFNPKFYLSAFPQVEVQKGYGLVQNPGYEIDE